MGSVEEQLKAKTEELDALKAKFEVWQGKAKQGVEQQRGRIVKLSEELAQAKADNETLSGQLATAQNALQAAQHAGAEHEAAATAAQQELQERTAELERERQSARKAREETEKGLRGVRAKAEEKAKDLLRVQAELAAAMQELKAHNERRFDASTEDWHHEFLVLKQKLESEADRHAAEVEALKEEIVARDKAIDGVTSSGQAAAAALAKEQEKVLQLEGELRQAKADAKASFEQQSERIAALAQKMEAASKAASQSDANHAAESKRLQDEIATLQERIKAKDKELATQQAEHEKFKKRSEQALRLSGKDRSSMNEDFELLKISVAEKDLEVAAMRAQCEENTATMVAMDSQLEAALATALRLESELEEARHQLQAQAAQDDTALTAEQWERHEKQLREDHANEIESLAAMHEEELARVVASSAAPVRAHSPTAPSSAGRSTIAHDTAYDSLLDQLEKTTLQLEKSKKAVVDLTKQNELLERRAKEASPMAMEAKAQSRMRDLERQLTAQAEQVWNLNHELSELRAAPTKASPQRPGSTRQQQDEYLRSVLVKFMCAKTDDVKASLVPILTTLVALQTSDLKQVYSANPGWAKVAH